MRDFVNQYGHNVHSQNGEDGIIAECVKRLGLAKGFCVEIGANDGQWMSNTRLLLENGWSGKLVEAEWSLYLQCQKNWAHRKDVTCICSRVDAHNVNAFVNEDCDLFSIDTDGSDYEIFKGLRAKPKIVIVEIDSSISPYQRGFNQDGGAGYLEMILLAYQKGYTTLCHTGNCILLRNDMVDLFSEVKDTSALSDVDVYFNRSWLKDEAA